MSITVYDEFALCEECGTRMWVSPALPRSAAESARRIFVAEHAVGGIAHPPKQRDFAEGVARAMLGLSA
jgi:hypothetical protein